MSITATSHNPPDLGGRTPTRADARAWAVAIIRDHLAHGVSEESLLAHTNQGGGSPARNGRPCYSYAYGGSYVWGGGNRQWVKAGQLGIALGRDTGHHDFMAVFSIRDLIREARSGTQLDMFGGAA